MADNYSQKSFASIYEDLLDFVEKSTTKFNPRNATEADPAVVILKLIAMLEDKHGYKFDMAMNQNYLDGVSDRDSAYELLKELGYLMKQARAAEGVIELLPDSAWLELKEGGAYVLPKHTIITDASKSVKYFTLQQEDYLKSDIVSEGKLTDKRLRIRVMAGEPFQITKDGFDYFTLKDVDEQGRLYLGKSGLAQNGVFIYTREGEGDNAIEVQDWTYLDFAILKPVGQWYEVQTAETGEMYIQFPPNFEALIADKKLVVWATYTTGSASNVTKSTLSVFENTNHKPYFAIRQAEDIYSGQDAESIAAATKNYYATKDVCNTIVTEQDFEAAIKNLLVQLISDKYPTQNARYFSNVVVYTAQDRRSNIRTKCGETEYTLFLPDDSEPSNQIDVIAMQASNDYQGSFRQITDDTAIELIQADLAQQLHNNSTIDADVRIDAETSRLLAVTTPQIRVRVSNYTISLDTQIRQKIKNYFYTTYKAENLEPGKKLDVQKIIDDITALSPNIVSVSISDLAYDVYDKLNVVDEEADSKVSIEGSISTPTSIQKEILARAVIRGDVPLFKFSNRYNTRSKQTAAYALMSSTDDGVQSGLESVLPIPLGANSSTYFSDSDSTLSPIAPIVSEFAVCTSSTDTNISTPNPFDTTDVRSKNKRVARILSANQLLQIRKPLYVAKDTYAYGMEVRFTPYYLTSEMTTSGTLAVGTLVAKGSSLKLGSDSTLDTSTGAVSLVNGSYKFNEDVEILKQTTILANSVLAEGSAIAPGSVLGGTTYADVAISADKDHTLAASERIFIRNSKGQLQKVCKDGDNISCSKGMTHSASYIQLSTDDKLTVNALDKTTITTDYVYVLILNHNSKIGINSTKGYMLEDGEVFIYADRGITEYVMLGPGTLLKTISGDVELKAKNSIEASSVEQSMFSPLPAALVSQAFEFYSAGKGHWFTYTLDAAGTTVISPEWHNIEQGSILCLFEGTPDNLATNKEVKADIGSALASYEGVDIEARMVMQLVTDVDGVVKIEYPVSIKLKATDGATARPIAPGDTAQAYLIASTPFNVMLTKSSENKSLLPGDKKALFSVATASKEGTATDADMSVKDVDFWLTDNSNKGTQAQIFTITCAVRKEKVCLFNLDFSTWGKRDVKIKVTNNNGTIYKLSDLLDNSVSRNSSHNSIEIDLTKSERFGVTILVETTVNPGSSFGLAFTSDVTENLINEVKGKKVRMTDFSYVEGYAKELGLPATAAMVDSESSELVDSLGIAHRVAELDTAKRFNYLCLPTEKYAYPLSAEAMFTKGHPVNGRVFPYIDLANAEIIITKER